MKYTLILLLQISALSLLAQHEPLDITIDFESYDPPSTLVVDEHPISKARYPFVDVHSHHWRLGDMDLNELIAQMDSMNMKIVVNLSGRGGERLLKMKENIVKSGYEDRIINFTNIEFRSITEPDWVEETVKQLVFDVKQGGARGLKIYKSQGMHHVDSLGNRIKINDPRIAPIWDKCGELGIPVLIHSADPKPFWAPHDSLNERWLELKLRPNRRRGPENPASWDTIIAEQHEMFKNHPNTTFINAHMGWFANDLNKLEQLMEDIPNMYIEIGAVIAELGRQPKSARQFLTKYQDRVLFGKDSYKPKEFPTYFRVLETEDEYFPYYKRYHAFWKMYGLGLSDEVLQKVYFKNALKIIPGLDESLFEVKPTEEMQIKGHIQAIFNGMRNGDARAMKTLFEEDAKLESVFFDKEGHTQYRESSVTKFAEAVAQPHDEVWDERILKYDIKIDGPLAVAWTPYTFYLGDKFSHCGVNVFTFTKSNEIWKIRQLRDTQRRSDCEEN